jgi:glutamine synthetase
MAGDSSSPLSLSRLSQNIESGHVDTVLVVFTDMQGRLQGKRVHAKFFIEEVMNHGVEACNYLLAVDVDMNTVSGYEISSWDSGYGDFMLRPDMSTLRAAPWLPGTAMVQSDLVWLDGQPVRQSPRQVLQAQVAEAQQLGCAALAGTELEFLVFEGTYQAAWDQDYKALRPATRYNVDYSILGTTEVEPLLRDIRNAMYNAGMTVESSKGECAPGQQELTFKYDDVLRTADNHVVFKAGAKELAGRHEKALTFMAKYDEREGNSCHIHMSLRGATDGSIVFAEDETVLAEDFDGRSPVFRSFVAGVLATLEDFTLLYAPNVNSYKRFQPGSFAPTAIAWGNDNRTCALRVVGAGPSLRLENRVPGGDANPYLALAAMLAGGLFGIRAGLPLEPPLQGNAYESKAARVPTTMREARDKFADSELAKSAFGEDVVAHYVRAADVELEAFNSSVTDWERKRGFERL